MEETNEKKDTVEKEFVSFPDIAADVINVLLYQGEKVAKAENLLAGPTETIYQGMEKQRSQYEDLCKYEMADGKVNIMYLIANQSRTDGKRLLRKAGYVGCVYREQYEGKTQNIFPVIEFVLYWGHPRWKSSRGTRRLFRKRKLFQSDMRIVADFLAEGNGYRSQRKIMHKAALIRMIKVLSGETDIEDVEAWMEKQGVREEDEVTVCELFDQYVRQGRAEGRVEGKVEGRAEGLAEGLNEGRIEGENRFAKLVQMLIDEGRSEELRRAVSDQKYRENLYAEVGIG